MTSWTDDRVEILKRGWADGMSATLIMRELNGESGVLTRNAVVGKAHRLNLPLRKTVTFSSRGGRIKRFNTPKSAAPRRHEQTTAAPAAPAPVVIEPLTLEHKLHFMAADNHQCRWPLWDDGTPFKDKFYCGSPGCDVLDRRPYCPSHSRMTVNPPMPRKPQKYWTERAA